MKINIITIFSGGQNEITKTINSVAKQNRDGIQVYHILVIRAVTEKTLRLVENYKQSSPYKVEILVDQDTSLYNAMNIGCSRVSQGFTLFLNGGDELNCNTILQRLKHIAPEYHHFFRVEQKFHKDSWIRPSIAREFELTRYSHQGILFSHSLGEIPRFDESLSINADSKWIRSIIKQPVKTHKEILCQFQLGGISNYPSWKSAKLRFEANGLRRGMIEVLKFVTRLILQDKLYYNFCAVLNAYEKVNK